MPYFRGTIKTPTDVLHGFQVFTFGSIPLKTYFPDSGTDMSLFSKHHNMNDIWDK